jgi:hypothetical protein
MTKRKPEPDESARIVVTPQMIEAGVKTFERWKGATTYDLAAAVYRAMSLAAPPRVDGECELNPTMLHALRLLGHSPSKK